MSADAKTARPWWPNESERGAYTAVGRLSAVTKQMEALLLALTGLDQMTPSEGRVVAMPRKVSARIGGYAIPSVTVELTVAEVRAILERNLAETREKMAQYIEEAREEVGLQ